MEYVLCFVTCQQQVLLIEKLTPAWQKGFLNLPGGKIEPRELPPEAAVRELFEETNLISGDTTELGIIEGNDWLVHVIGCDIGGQLSHSYSKTCEPIQWVPIQKAVRRTDLIPNLRLIIPLAAYGVNGWVLREENGNYRISII